MAESSDAITGKLDFYDVLGYLVPGLVLVGLLSLPFGLIKGSWPSTSLTSAVLYLVGAHILGHILQGFLRAWENIPEIRDSKNEMRAPSSVLLDADQEPLARLRTKIGELAEKFWEIPAAELLADKHDSDRAAIFLQARNLLLQSKKQSYFEQFEGKYALMGGMAAGLLIISAYYAGWAVALMPSAYILDWRECAAHALVPDLFVFVLYLVIIQILDHTIRKKRKNKKFLWVYRVVLLLMLGSGAFFGGIVVARTSQARSETHNATETQKGDSTPCSVCCVGKADSSDESKATPALQIEHKATFMLILALVAFGAGVRCYGAYKAFAREFAMGVWRDFANFDLVCESANKSAADGKLKDKNNSNHGEGGHEPSSTEQEQ
jgi:hypothetical protein